MYGEGFLLYCTLSNLPVSLRENWNDPRTSEMITSNKRQDQLGMTSICGRFCESHRAQTILSSCQRTNWILGLRSLPVLQGINKMSCAAVKRIKWCYPDGAVFKRTEMSSFVVIHLYLPGSSAERKFKYDIKTRTHPSCMKTKQHSTRRPRHLPAVPSRCVCK